MQTNLPVINRDRRRAESPVAGPVARRTRPPRCAHIKPTPKALADGDTRSPTRAAPRRPQRLRFRRTRLEAELQLFSERYAATSGYRVSLAYLSRVDVFVIMLGSQVVGGFVVNQSAPFRTLGVIDDVARAPVEALVDADHTAEVACVWLEPRVRGRVVSAQLWIGLMWQLGRQPRRYVLWTTQVDVLRRFYELAGPRVLYEGPITIDGRRDHGWVYVSPVWRRWVAMARFAARRLVAGSAGSAGGRQRS